MQARAWTAAIVLAGAIAEGALAYLMSRKGPAALTAASIVRAKHTNAAGKVLAEPAEDWTLWAYIEVAEEMGCLSATTSAIAHGVLRDFRNMVHPRKQIRDGLTPSDHVAHGSVVYLRALIADVAKNA